MSTSINSGLPVVDTMSLCYGIQFAADRCGSAEIVATTSRDAPAYTVVAIGDAQIGEFDGCHECSDDAGVAGGNFYCCCLPHFIG